MGSNPASPTHVMCRNMVRYVPAFLLCGCVADRVCFGIETTGLLRPGVCDVARHWNRVNPHFEGSPFLLWLMPGGPIATHRNEAYEG